MPLFAKSTVVDPDGPAAPLEAYKEGRRDERRTIEAAPRDRRGRGGSLLGAFMFLVLAAIVVGMIVLVVQDGSFAAAGAAVDAALRSFG